MADEQRVAGDGGEWRISPRPASDAVVLANDYLGYLADRNYSPQTVRAYTFSLLSFCRWLTDEPSVLDAVTTDVLLRFLAWCRQASMSGRPDPKVVRMEGRREDPEPRDCSAIPSRREWGDCYPQPVSNADARCAGRAGMRVLRPCAETWASAVLELWRPAAG
jgi:hypothetical protein